MRAVFFSNVLLRVVFFQVWFTLAAVTHVSRSVFDQVFLSTRTHKVITRAHHSVPLSFGCVPYVAAAKTVPASR